MTPTSIEPGTPRWPTQLTDLGKGQPRRLWVSGDGDLRLLALRSVAIVGARNATAYGITTATNLAADLASAGWVVVSGAALGIDAAAHRGALAAGATVAVLAGGVDVPSPRSNAALLNRVAASGLIVSEQPLGAIPAKHRFLERNRIIAGLARAVVVVEAAHRSGALNTANWAEQLGRHVLAVPGPAASPMSRGTHGLIRERQAVLVQDADDVLEILEPMTGPAVIEPTIGPGVMESLTGPEVTEPMTRREGGVSDGRLGGLEAAR